MRRRSSEDDVVFAGDVYAGLNLNLTDFLFLGAEAKYIVTDQTAIGFDFTGVAVTGSLGFRF